MIVLINQVKSCEKVVYVCMVFKYLCLFWIKEPLNLNDIIDIFYSYVVYSMFSGSVSEVIVGITMSGTSLIQGKI